MSYAWGFLKTDKQTIIAGSIIVGVIICFFIGIPLLRIFGYYEFEIPLWFWILFIVVVFPTVSFFTFKMAKYKKLKK
jgi:hypothetical protein